MIFITKDKPQSKYSKFYKVDEDISTKIETYRIGENIGVGGNATVHECTDRKGNVWAVKFLLNLSDKSRVRFKQEADVLQKMNHQHIIKCVDIGHTDAIDAKDEKLISIPYIILEKADMNIVDYMRRTDVVGYDVYAPQIRGLADALSHLHQYAVHRDIKPENVLVRGETWLLSDFGLCTAVDNEERIDITKPQDRIGPKYWLSPEAIDKVYFGQNEIDKTSDIYQLCAVFWFIITRRYPLGMIEEEDYCDYDMAICREILGSLKYHKNKRPQTARILYENICNVTINKEI